MKTYEEFIFRASEAHPRKDFWRELRALYVDNGTMQLLVKMILEQRASLMETMAARHMLSDADIRAAIGTQGQISGIDVILRSIFEAMQPAEGDNDEVSGNSGAAAP